MRVRLLEVRSLIALATILFVGLGAVSCRTPEGDTAGEQRAHIKKVNTEILSTVYKAQPEARALVDSAAGYGTFSNIETKTMFLGSGNGYGLAVDRATGKRTFMKLRKIQIGLGVGIQEFQLLVIFKDPAKFKEFVAGGWQFGGGADAALEHREEDGAQAGVQLSAKMDPVVIQLTEAGVSIGATVDGIKYSQNDELN